MPRVSNHTRRQASVDHPRHPPQSLQAQALQHSHQVPQVSDYESDNPAYASDLPLPRPPETRTNDELNLTVLQRHNHEVSSILSIAPYAVIYEFNAQPEPTWNKAGIEGSLFICQLTPGPQLREDRYSAMLREANVCVCLICYCTFVVTGPFCSTCFSPVMSFSGM